MRFRALGVLILGLGLLWAAAPAAAHHSFAAEFDASQPVTIQGRVTRIAWANPHVWIYVNVEDENGARHVAESIDDEGRRRKRLEKYRSSFLQTYNAVQSWQAVQLEDGASPFKKPEVKVGGVR